MHFIDGGVQFNEFLCISSKKFFSPVSYIDFHIAESLSTFIDILKID